MSVSILSLALIAIAYRLGGLLPGRLRGVDIRTNGSGNAGDTNALSAPGQLRKRT